MDFTRSTFIKTIKIVSIILAITIIAGYAAWRSYDYARGPKITIFEPLNNSSMATSTIIIRGQAERINNILLNGSALIVDEKGNFSRISAIFPGMNILTFTAEDKFGRKIRQELRIFGTIKPPNSPISTTTI